MGITYKGDWSDISTADIDSTVKTFAKLIRKMDGITAPKNLLTQLRNCLIMNRKYSRSTYNCETKKIKLNIPNSRFSMMTFHEYKSFAKDPSIGSIDCDSPLMYVKVLMAHEFAHKVQYELAPGTPWGRQEKDWWKPHGKTFKNVYGYLRHNILKG